MAASWFWLAWKGGGVGGALGCDKVALETGLAQYQKSEYEINIARVREGKRVLGIADALVKRDGTEIYTAEGIKVGLFTSLDDFG